MSHTIKDYMSWVPHDGEIVIITSEDIGKGLLGIILGRHNKFDNLYKTFVGGRQLYVHYYEMIPVWLYDVRV